MKWIELHTNLRTHFKIRKGATLLGVTVREFGGLWVWLLCWAGQHVESGDLTDFSAADIAAEVAWDGDPEKLLDALLGCGPGSRSGLLERTPDERLLIHDWEDYAGKYLDGQDAYHEANSARAEAGRTRRESARAWLTEFLAGGSQPSSAIKSVGGGHGHSWRTLERASSDMGIAKFRELGGPAWRWALDPQATPPCPQANQTKPNQTNHTKQDKSASPDLAGSLKALAAAAAQDKDDGVAEKLKSLGDQVEGGKPLSPKQSAMARGMAAGLRKSWKPAQTVNAMKGNPGTQMQQLVAACAAKVLKLKGTP